MTLYIPGLGDLMDYELSYHDIHAKNIMKVAGDIKRRTMPAAAMYYDTDSCIRYYLNPNTKTQETTGYQINTIKPIFHREKINKIYKILLDEMYPGYKYNCTLELFIQFAKSHYLKPYCQWCVIDFIIKNNIKKLVKKWRINKKNRFNKIKLRELTG